MFISEIVPEPEIVPLPEPDVCPELEPGQPDNPERETGPERVKVAGQPKSSIEAMKEMGATAMPEVKSNIHCLTIVGQIEGHLVLPPQNKTTKYEHMIPQLVALEQSPEVEGVLILLNTVGGDVEAGLAIAEMIAGISKPTVSVVLGGGHSIGVPISRKSQPIGEKQAGTSVPGFF